MALSSYISLPDIIMIITIIYLSTWHHHNLSKQHIKLDCIDTIWTNHWVFNHVCLYVTSTWWKITSLNHNWSQTALTQYGDKRMGHAGKKGSLLFIDCWWIMKPAAQDVMVIFIKASHSYSQGLAVSMVKGSGTAIFTVCKSAGAWGLIRLWKRNAES